MTHIRRIETYFPSEWFCDRSASRTCAFHTVWRRNGVVGRERRLFGRVVGQPESAGINRHGRPYRRSKPRSLANSGTRLLSSHRGHGAGVANRRNERRIGAIFEAKREISMIRSQQPGQRGLSDWRDDRCVGM